MGGQYLDTQMQIMDRKRHNLDNGQEIRKNLRARIGQRVSHPGHQTTNPGPNNRPIDSKLSINNSWLFGPRFCASLSSSSCLSLGRRASVLRLKKKSSDLRMPSEALSAKREASGSPPKEAIRSPIQWGLTDTNTSSTICV